MKICIYIFLIFAELFIINCRDIKKGDSNKGQLHVQENNFSQQRKYMVDSQIRKRGVVDSLVLQAMLKVERHKFVPQQYHEHAYKDHPLPIGNDQTISQPYIVAFMTEALNLTGAEKVLEIGTGSGYQAAILAEIVKEVFSVEIIPALATASAELLQSLGYRNVKVKCADGYQGWKEFAPFDAIIVTAAPEFIPQPLIDQLKVGGRMIIPVGDYYQELIKINKLENGKIIKKSILPVRFVPMTGEAQRK